MSLSFPSFGVFAAPPVRISDLPANTTSSRSGSVDVLRGLSIYAIVWFHCAAPGAWGGYAGLHAMTALSVYFAAKTASQRNAWATVVRGRFDRLLVPWVFWSVLYASLLIARHSRFEPWMALSGPSIHLWFLPFIFVVGSTITLASRAGSLALSPAGAIALAAIGAVLAATNAVLVPRLSAYAPVTQWLDVAPAVMIGLAAAAASGAGGRRAMAAVALAAAIAFAAATLILFNEWSPVANPRWAVGVAVFLAAVVLRVPGNAMTAFVGRTSYGVYLCHELVKQMVLRVGAPPHAVTTAVIVVLLAVIVTAAIERTWLRRFVG